MPLSHSSVVRLTANLDKQPSPFSETDQELILDIAVARCLAVKPEPKSKPFQEGVRSMLACRLFGRVIGTKPYPHGSPSRDAFEAGLDEGYKAARLIRDGGWNLFLESTAA